MHKPAEVPFLVWTYPSRPKKGPTKSGATVPLNKSFIPLPDTENSVFFQLEKFLPICPAHGIPPLGTELLSNIHLWNSAIL